MAAFARGGLAPDAPQIRGPARPDRRLSYKSQGPKTKGVLEILRDRPLTIHHGGQIS